MTERRWQPPPMEPNPEPASKVTVDEKVVRKMLTVNPAMRKGRTTFQVKKALERGEGVAAQESAAGAPTKAQAGAAKPCPAAAGETRRELEDAFDFFVRGKTERLREKLEDLAAQRQAIVAAEAAARADVAEQVKSFVSLLDDQALAVHGKNALSKHADLLKELGLSVAALLELAQKGKR